jgi:hypothetical protein
MTIGHDRAVVELQALLETFELRLMIASGLLDEPLARSLFE